MLDFPSVLSTGRVHGRFIIAVIDGPDPGDEPDVIPAKGRIVFKASIEYTTVGEGADAVTMILAPVAGVLDDEGYLCTPHPETGEPMYRGVVLTATDDPDMSVTGWTWSADYRFEPSGTVTYKIPAHSFELPSMADRDLSTLVKVPSSPGYGLPQAEGAALRAEAAAVESSASAAQALSVAQSVRDDADAGLFDGAQGLPGNATMRVDTTVGTRIFISDGTTEHMISFDSGWRDITSLLLPGLFDNRPGTRLWIRRRDGNVELSMTAWTAAGLSGIAKSAATAITAELDPAFRPNPNTGGSLATGLILTSGLDIVELTNFAHGATLQLRGTGSGNWVATTGIRLYGIWPTRNPLPTTLPGIPA